MAAAVDQVSIGRVPVCARQLGGPSSNAQSVAMRSFFDVPCSGVEEFVGEDDAAEANMRHLAESIPRGVGGVEPDAVSIIGQSAAKSSLRLTTSRLPIPTWRPIHSRPRLVRR